MTVVVEKEREAEKVHRGSVTSCFMSTTAMYVVTAGHDRRLVAMDAVSMKTAHVWLSEAAPIMACAPSPTACGTQGCRWGLAPFIYATASSDGVLRLLPSTEGGVNNPLCECKTGKALTCCAFAPDGRVVASGGVGGCISLWDATTGDLVQHLYDHNCEDTSATCIAFTSDGNNLVTSMTDGLVITFDLLTGKTQTFDLSVKEVHHHRVKSFFLEVTSCSFSADGQHILVSTSEWNQPVLILNASDGKTKVVVQGHNAPVNVAVYSPTNASRILTGCSDGSVKLHDAESGKLLHSWLGHKSNVECVSWAPDGTEIISCSLDGSTKICKVPSEFL